MFTCIHSHNKALPIPVDQTRWTSRGGLRQARTQVWSVNFLQPQINHKKGLYFWDTMCVVCCALCVVCCVFCVVCCVLCVCCVCVVCVLCVCCVCVVCVLCVC